MIKTVHITNYYHANSGGVSTSYNKLLEAAGREKRFVRLIVPGESEGVEDVNPFARIYFIKAGFSRVFDKRYRVMWPWNSYIFDRSPIKTILRDEAPDLIEVGEKYTLSLMAGLIRKAIMNVSAPRPALVHLSCERMDDNVSSFISDNRFSRSFAKAYIRNYILPMFDFHLANSAYTASELLDAGEGAGNAFRSLCWRLLRSPEIPIADRVFVNECGVDHETFSSFRKSPEVRSSMLARYGLPANAKVLLYAGRLSPEKNVDILPDIMRTLASAKNNDYRLLVAGDGPLKTSLGDRFAKFCGTSVVMLGNISDRAQLADIYANCDAFIHPNPREPFGIAPLEAMSAGLPVVAPNSGGLLSYANDSNAWLVQPTAVEFAAAIRDIIENPVAAASRANMAIATSERYTWERSTTNLFALYDRLHADFINRRPLYDHLQPSTSPVMVNTNSTHGRS
ncbi:MAG: glycosyltransferase [Acidobacteriota bacterium]